MATTKKKSYKGKYPGREAFKEQMRKDEKRMKDEKARKSMPRKARRTSKKKA